MKEHLRNDLFTLLERRFTDEEIRFIGACFDEAIQTYNVEKQETALAVVGRDEFVQIIKTYVVVKKIEGWSDATAKNYYTTLMYFARAQRRPIGELTANDVRLFLYQYQSERKISDSSLDHVRSVICSFLKWAASEKYIPSNPAENVRPIKFESKPRKAMSQLELEMIRRGCKTARDLAMVEVFYSTGCRVSELSAIKISDVDWHTNEVRLFGKGRKYRTSYLNAKAIVALREYLNVRKHTTEYLFCNERGGGQMKKANIERAIHAIAKNAGLNDKNITPHIFRHTTATNALQNGMNVEEIQKLLGHANISTTMIYAKASQEDVRAKHQKCVI